MAKKKKTVANGAITAIAVGGYKSLSNKCRIDLAPLTILAGPNSAGKSSIMQPFLLLKQTMEASYEPGALVLDGPSVKFTSTDQVFSKIAGRKIAEEFSLLIETGRTKTIEYFYKKRLRKGIQAVRMKRAYPVNADTHYM